jgi:hypothetical protein
MEGSGMVGWIVPSIHFGTKILRFVRGQKIISTAKQLAVTDVLRRVHVQAIHRARRLAAACAAEDNTKSETLIASELCNDYQRVMARLLELNPNQLHCCIKLIAPKKDPNDEDQLGTWVRSDPPDGRQVDNFHAIGKNSAWSAFYGRFDGQTKWESTNCFSCNNLPSHGSAFRSERENWQQYYQSTLVFPVNHAKNDSGTELARLGFLAFDSPRTGSFLGAPDIFDYRERLHEYRDRLLEWPPFHLGAIFADILGSALAFGSHRWEPGNGNHQRRTEHAKESVEHDEFPGAVDEPHSTKGN